MGRWRDDMKEMVSDGIPYAILGETCRMLYANDYRNGWQKEENVSGSEGTTGRTEHDQVVPRQREEEEGKQPRVRVYLFQTLQVEWVVASSGQENAWNGRVSARSLLKVLLCAPGRQATRGQLLGILWPQTDEAKAQEGLRSALKVLRKVFTTATGEVLLETREDLVMLAGQDRLWCDVDAFEALIHQVDRRMHSAHPDKLLALLEEARAVVRGAFLAHDTLAEWYTYRWVRTRRQAVQTLRRRMIRSLADLLIQKGEQRQAEALLAEHLTRFPSDQDALTRLINLLVEQNCVDEALSFYDRCASVLAASEKRPAEHLRKLATALRTQFVSKISSTDRVSSGGEASVWSQPYNARYDPALSVAFERVSPLSPLTMEQVLPSASCTYSQPPSHPIFRESGEDQKTFLQTRRSLLHDLFMRGCAALVLSPYALVAAQSSDPMQLSLLEELETMTRSYWRLCANTAFDLLGHLIEHFRTTISLLQQGTPHETLQRVCSLAAETAQLVGKTLFDMQDYALAWSYYTFSLKAAQAAANHDLWAAGLGRTILLLLYWEQPRRALSLLHEAHQLAIQSKRITCWLLAVEAEVHASLLDAVSCATTLEAARSIAQQEHLGEDRYAIALNASRLAGYEGACFIRLHQPEKALVALQQALVLLERAAIR